MDDSECDVVVRGAGVAGLSAALHLVESARGGAAPRVIVVDDDRAEGGPIAGPTALLPTPQPDPAALAERFAPAVRARLERLGRASLDAIERFASRFDDACGFRRVPWIHRALGSGRAADESPATVAIVDLDAFHARLRTAAASRGVRVVAAADADAATRGAIRTVFALDAPLVRQDAWVREVAIAGRAQRIVGTAESPRAARIVTLGSGFGVLATDERGRVVAAEGCEPSNRGDPFDRGPEPTGQSRLERFARECVPEIQIVQRESFAAAFTCDGLPLVGPHPARDGALLCGSWNGAGATFEFACGSVLAEWIVAGRPADESWTLFSPRRML